MNDEGLTLDADRCVLIIPRPAERRDDRRRRLRRDRLPEHAKEQNVVANVKALAETCRGSCIPVIHVHYIVEPGAPG